MTFDKEQLAWAAGLFEGEGCFHYRANPRCTVAKLESTDEDVVRKFGSTLGFGSVSGPNDKGANKSTWTWRVSSFELFQQTVTCFWPYLGDRRKLKARESMFAYLHHPMLQRQGRKKMPAQRLTEKQVSEIRRFLSLNTLSQTEIAANFGVSPALINLIARGRRHQEKPCLLTK